jgi:hypothetical protein
LLFRAWDSGLAEKANPFDEEIEKTWARQWLFYGNSIRYASAMTGAFDYASFKNGWWELSEKLQTMKERLRTNTIKSGGTPDKQSHISKKESRE